MSQFTIKPDAVKSQAGIFTQAEGNLNTQANDIDNVKDGLDASLAECAPLLAAVAASTRLNATSTGKLGAALLNIINFYKNFDVEIHDNIEAPESKNPLPVDSGIAAGKLNPEDYKIPLDFNQGEKYCGYDPSNYNPNAKLIQQLLKMAGIKCSADGLYGPNTAKALMEFYEKYGAEFGLTPCQFGENGELTFVDQRTLAAMFAVAQRNMTPELMAAYNSGNLDLSGMNVGDKTDWLAWAAAQAGFKEVGTNGTPFGKFTGTDGQPWCASFVSWCLFQSGDDTLPYTASTWQMKQDAIAKGIYRDLSSPDYANYVPSAGDVFYRKTTEGGHVGFISNVVPNSDGTYTITTLEGNSSDMATSHTYTLTQEEFKTKWGGFIDMGRDSRNSGGPSVATTEDNGETR